MLRHIIFTAILLMAVASASAHYSIHSATSGVMVENGSGSNPAKNGLEIKANDYLIIPTGGEVEIYNDLDKNIYKSVSTGKISVTKLMIEAKKQASDNNKNVASRLRLSKSQASEPEGEKIYVEKGMVRRSLAVFDPEAEHVQVNSKSLGQLIAKYLKDNPETGFNGVDVMVSKGDSDDSAVYFKIVNSLDFPVYFNVLKFDATPEGDNRKVEISNMGQPDGSYVLLPGQALTRESIYPLPEDEKHLLVVTHFRYDLDEVVDETANALNNGNEGNIGEPQFPLLITKL